VPLESHRRIVKALTSRGYNADREAVTLLANAPDSALALEAVLDYAPDDAFVITVEHVRATLDGGAAPDPSADTADTDTTAADSVDTDTTAADATASDTSPARADPQPPVGTEPTTTADPQADPSVSTATDSPKSIDTTTETPEATDSSPVETKGSGSGRIGSRTPTPAEIVGDVTGQSTGTGEYTEFVNVFRDRYERLSKMLKGRVNHRPAEAIQKMPGGSDADMVGLVNDIRSTASGHWLVELEDTTGTFPCLVMKDRDFASMVDDMLLDECIAVSGTLSDDAGIMFVDAMHFPDVPRTHRPNTADRHVQAALISDVHVGSQEFAADAWERFTSWLHTEEAEPVEYLLIAGDMVEGVGVYPNQDEELTIVDIYEQYEAFAERLKEVPGDMEIIMIPGNHDAVRLAEPQPAFDEELRDIMRAHDARFTGNPSTVTVEGVSVLMYHGVSLDEVIAELPADKASYDEPHKAMYQLLRKRHVAPQYGGHTRIAPEEKDYLVIEDVPDVFHTGHVHKLGWGKYHNVVAVNSGCWQEQTDFQKSVNINPDYGYAPILDLDTLEMTVRKFH
jgi:DNA polymerase II small subunit